jgi:hypothetical protein
MFNTRINKKMVKQLNYEKLGGLLIVTYKHFSHYFMI